ncbi:hypothetical protein [uncultured Cohaesibacter sp.]|uniref:hypothetical protein n=1 Tax=uncultured Cohaesibacter sp. TaxID=1002546 RepID=UPI0029C86633|nr:hypothetical protein [uncultured Cohaesibacter sp.]
MFQQSQLAEHCGRQDVASKNAELAYRHSPSVRTAWRFAVCLARCKEMVAAEELLREALKTYPGSKSLMEELCRILAATQGWSEELRTSNEMVRSEVIDLDRFIRELADIAIQNGHADVDLSFLEIQTS